MDKEIIKESAKQYYKENIEGEPLTENIPIECYIKGAEFVLSINNKNYKNVLKTLRSVQKTLIDKNLHLEWMQILNSLRLCAGMELLKLNKAE